jgi:ribosomal protein L40E
MSLLKRSQKLCPKCKEKNPIRSFFCRKCKYQYPKKEKEIIENNTLEQFLLKKRQQPENAPTPFKNLKITPLKLIINIDEEFEESEDFILIKEDFENIIKINKEKNECSFNINNIAECLKYSFDTYSSYKEIYLNIIFQNLEDNNIYSSFIKTEETNVLNNYLFKFKKNNDEIYFKNILTKIFYQKQKENQVFLIQIIDNKLYCLLFNYISRKLYQIFLLEKKFIILKFDILFNDTNKSLQIIFSDSSNKIFYYIFSLFKKNLKCLGIFENHFLNRITHLKFLKVRQKNSENIFYFSVCSRDGLLLILDNNDNVLFKHKNYQTWITQIDYDIAHDIILFLTNFNDRMVGIKLTNKKEPIIKRIHDTNNPYYIYINDIDDKIYFLDYQGNILSIKTILIEDMFKTSKSKKREEYKPKLEYKVPEEKKDIFLNKAYVLRLFDKKDEKKIAILQYVNSINFIQI